MVKKPNTVPLPTSTRRKPQPKNHWPRFSVEEKQLIEGFLMRLALDARAGLVSANELLRLSPENPSHVEQLSYWKHVISALRWALHQAQHRQRSLVPEERDRMAQELAQ